MSIVKSLLRQVDAICRKYGDGQVAEIHVSVGPLSGVEPMLLTSALEQLAPVELGADARLIVEQVPLSAHCRRCTHDFEIADFTFRCPRCCDERVQVTGGDEIQLVSVTIRQPQATSEVT